MSGEAEAAGALATAGLVAGAIEKGDAGAVAEGPCQNCGATLAGRYCSNCGQSARPHRTLSGMVGEFLFNLWNFDTKAWRTLPMLLFRPGTLTRDYVYGKRARYISPLAAFLVSIFFMFFAFSTVEMPDNTRNGAVQVTAEDLAEARQALAQAQAELARARANPDPDEPAGLEERLAGGAVRIAQGEVQRLERQLARQQEREAAAHADAASEAAPQGARVGPNVAVSVNGQPVREGSTWQEEFIAAIDRGDVTVNLGHPALNARALQTLRNPDLALYQIKEAASTYSFLLAPLSLPFIALLFLWKRGVTLYDHMTYALYGLGFAALLFSGVALLGKVPFVGWTASWLLVALPVHMFFHLKGAYALGWFSALWRTFLLLNFAVIVASVFFTLVIILGLTG